MLISVLFQYNFGNRIQSEKDNKKMKGHEEAEDAAVLRQKG